MWTYVVQIANAIKVAHDAGLAVRMIDATKVLLTGKNRYIHDSIIMQRKYHIKSYLLTGYALAHVG